MLGMIRKNWFLIAILFVVLIGILYPSLGILLNPNKAVQKVILFILFVNIGMTLATETVIKNITNIKLHLFMQFYIYIFTPLFFFILFSFFKSIVSLDTLAGIYALASLPTTVSTCIVFTQLSKGNVTATIFNAVLANILGIFITPLLLSFLLKDTGRMIPAEELLKFFKDLALTILLPILCGQILRLGLKGIINKNKNLLGIISNIFLLTIVFFTISFAAKDPNFLITVRNSSYVFILLAISHLLLILIVYYTSRWLKFAKEDRISILYTTTQKTLAFGVPILTAYFVNNPGTLGMAILVLLFYHPWQLVVASILRHYVERIIK